MTSKLIPSDPTSVTVIREVTPNITTVSAPFSRFGSVKIGGRGTIVKLANGSLAVFSPTALTDDVKARVKDMGDNVGYLAALDYEHHLFLGDWSKAYPAAKVIGVEGLDEKRKGMKEADLPGGHVSFEVVFTAKDKATTKVDEAFDAEFDYEYVPSHVNKELVFNYKTGRTLIEGDLIFNLPAIEQYSKSKESPHSGFATKLFNGAQNTSGTAIWQKRFIWNMAAKDKPAFAESMRKIEGWDFDRIIPCHGDVIETGGKSVFKKVMEWHLTGKR